MTFLELKIVSVPFCINEMTLGVLMTYVDSEMEREREFPYMKIQ